MKYLLYFLSLILLPHSLCDYNTFSSFLVDDPDFSLINQFPEYLKLINHTYIINSEDLQLCINKSEHISEEMKGELSLKKFFSLDPNLYYYSRFNIIYEHINARIKYCVLNNAFEPCPCNDTSIDDPIFIKPVQENKCLENDPNKCVKLKEETPREVEFRRLATNNDGNCQKCNGKELTECLLNKLSEDNVYFNELLISIVYSDDWKSIIQNLINDESLTITDCLTESRCSPFFQ